METFNRLIRKAHPIDEDSEMVSQGQDLHVATTAAELQSPFELGPIVAYESSQRHSALPPGTTSQIGRTLTFRQSRSPERRSPERHGTLQVDKRLVQKVRVVGRNDPRHAIQLEELENKLNAQQEMLTSFKKQLEDAGYSLAKAQEAQKVAEEGATRFREHAYEAAKAKQKAEEDARLAAEEKRKAEEDARQAIYAKQQVEEELRKAAEAKHQAEERAADENEVVQREMEARIMKAMEEVRKATDAKQRAEDVQNVVEAQRQAETRVMNEKEVAQKEAETSMAKALKDEEAKRKVLQERTMRAEEALARANVQSNRLGKGKSNEVAACASDDDDVLAIELQLKDREEETKAGTRQVSITDIDMGEVKGDAEVQVERDSAGEGMVIDIPHDKEWRALMPGDLIISGHLTNVQPTASGSRRRVQDTRPWKSSQGASGRLKVANTDTVVHDSYVPPIPKAGREKRTMGGAGPKLKANRLYPSSRAGDHQTSASPASGWSSSPNENVDDANVVRERQPIVRVATRESEFAAANGASPSRGGPTNNSFKETSMAMLELMQQQINFLIINASKPQKRSQWESPPEFKVTPDRSRDRERTMAMHWVRKEMNKLLMIEKDNDIAEFTDILNPKSSQALEMARYEKDQTGEGPCLEPMVPNFVVLAGKWNADLWVLFRKHCIEIGYAETGHLLEEEEEEEPIKALFFERIARLKYLLNTHKPKPGETLAELQERLERTSKKRLSRQRQHNRRKTVSCACVVQGWADEKQLFKTRQGICADHMPSKDCTNPTPNEEAYSHIFSVIERLGLEGMSSDESDVDDLGRATFTTKRMPWRARKVTEMLMRVDKDYNRTNMFGNQKSGNPARHRKRQRGRDSARKAPAEKPGNFYDRDWYRTLSAKQKKDLRKESDEDLWDIEDDD